TERSKHGCLTCHAPADFLFCSHLICHSSRPSIITINATKIRPQPPTTTHGHGASPKSSPNPPPPMAMAPSPKSSPNPTTHPWPWRRHQVLPQPPTTTHGHGSVDPVDPTSHNVNDPINEPSREPHGATPIDRCCLTTFTSCAGTGVAHDAANGAVNATVRYNVTTNGQPSFRSLCAWKHGFVSIGIAWRSCSTALCLIRTQCCLLLLFPSLHFYPRRLLIWIFICVSFVMSPLLFFFFFPSPDFCFFYKLVIHGAAAYS
ncbi:hypothetical protein CUMW_215540, partial [Citrus unshiu]